jgi:predicted GNAT superfamily acetyltransferase
MWIANAVKQINEIQGGSMQVECVVTGFDLKIKVNDVIRNHQTDGTIQQATIETFTTDFTIAESRQTITLDKEEFTKAQDAITEGVKNFRDHFFPFLNTVLEKGCIIVDNIFEMKNKPTPEPQTPTGMWQT